MMIAARSTPSMTAQTEDLKSMSRMLAARVPVHAPVPGMGMPTNSSRARKRPFLLAFCLSFSPAMCPFSRHQVKKGPMKRLSFPHSSTFLAKKKMTGTGSMLPTTQMI